MKRFALTAIGRDKPGIVAAVAEALYRHDCNIEDSSMTILEDEFAIILVMSMPDGKAKRLLTKDLKKTEKALDLSIHLKELPEKGPGKSLPGSHIITLHGADSPGIIYRTAELLARLKINITDLETKVIGEEHKAYMMIIEVSMPPGLAVDEVEERLRELGKTLGVTIRIKPVEAFEPL
ncbi:MAG: amino acid-binding protein [Deltaproteobacteria bacterium]|nr:amino acid-binding protein [Deltaproteobacteria bacterium]